jgi:hypothetical protein
MRKQTKLSLIIIVAVLLGGCGLLTGTNPDTNQHIPAGTGRRHRFRTDLFPIRAPSARDDALFPGSRQ